jgi:hypothetical protein
MPRLGDRQRQGSASRYAKGMEDTMSLLPGALRAAFKRARWPADFYIEPDWVVRALFGATPFDEPVHDPAAGFGNIVNVAREHGYEATGSDLVDRGYGFPEQEFLTDWTRRPTLIFNAPYRKNEAFVAHGLEVADTVAAVVRVPFLCGQKRYWKLYSVARPALVLILSERPSMPPGGTNIKPRGGTADYCWVIWRRSHRGPSLIEWLPPRQPLKERRTPRKERPHGALAEVP